MFPLSKPQAPSPAGFPDTIGQSLGYSTGGSNRPRFGDPYTAPGEFDIKSLRDQIAKAFVTIESHSGPSLVGMLKDAWEAAKAPGRAYHEGMTPEDMIKAGTDFAMTMGAGGSLVPRPRGSLGTFGGLKAQTADLDKLHQAVKFERAGVPADDIWKSTGWGRGADGKWRFEIDDARAHMSTEGQTSLMMDEPIKAGDDFLHPELYKAYPQLKDTGLRTEAKEGIGGTSYGGTIGLHPSVVDSPKLNSVTLHELQHEIQNIENFAKGNNVDNPYHNVRIALAKLVESGTDEQRIEALKLVRKLQEVPKKKLYRGTGGEVEARNVQTRQHFSPLQRAMQSPWTTEDIPRASQLLFGQTK